MQRGCLEELKQKKNWSTWEKKRRKTLPKEGLCTGGEKKKFGERGNRRGVDAKEQGPPNTTPT